MTTLNSQQARAYALFDNLDRSEVADVTFRDQVAAIHQFCNEKQFKNMLEVGLGVGGSAICMLDATEGTLVTMDPFQNTLFKNRGVSNLQRAGFWHRVEFYEYPSIDVLHSLALNRRRCDFIYVDGDHRFDTALVDFYYSDLPLERDGYGYSTTSTSPSSVILSLSSHPDLFFVDSPGRSRILNLEGWHGGVLETEIQSGSSWRRLLEFRKLHLLRAPDTVSEVRFSSRLSPEYEQRTDCLTFCAIFQARNQNWLQIELEGPGT